MPKIYVVLALLAVAACDRPSAGNADTSASATASASASPSASPSTPAAPRPGVAPCPGTPGADSVCFHAERPYDFAGDGRPFRVTVDGRGPAVDSMRVALRVARGDTVLYRDEWTTELYGRYDGRPVPRDSSRRRAEAQLARLLADSAFRPTRAFLGGASDVGSMMREAIGFDVSVDAERRRRGLTPADTLPTAAAQSPQPVNDSARVAALVGELREAPAFRYFAGGEATYAIAWSAREGRFVVVFACC
jgi:hypothetical protein